MENRNRNTSLLLIAAGLFLLLGNLIGFFTVTALIIVWLGVYKIRSSEERTGYILLIIGVIILLSNHFSVIIAIILISLGYYYVKSKQVHRNESYVQKQNILQSLKWNHEPWVLKNMSIWSVIGEMDLDLSLALPESEETTLIFQGIVGDIDMIVPEDFGVTVHATVLFGQTDVEKEREAGVMNKVVWTSPNYETADHKVKLMLSYIIGDIDIKVL